MVYSSGSFAVMRGCFLLLKSNLLVCSWLHLFSCWFCHIAKFVLST